MRTGSLFLSAVLLLSACSSKQANPAPTPRPAPRPTRPGPPTELERRIARLELSLMEKEAQVDELQTQLDDARQEVVRAMAKLQTLASRAEAASGIAEAEVALQTLKATGQLATPEGTQATRMLKESSAEFDKQNYGGALYLANQAKTLASAAKGRLSAGERGAHARGDGVCAADPVDRVRAGNVRAGPGTGTRIEFAVEAGDALIGYSYVDEWIRIGDDAGRGGWIFRSLVARP